VLTVGGSILRMTISQGVAVVILLLAIIAGLLEWRITRPQTIPPPECDGSARPNLWVSLLLLAAFPPFILSLSVVTCYIYKVIAFVALILSVLLYLLWRAGGKREPKADSDASTARSVRAVVPLLMIPLGLYLTLWAIAYVTPDQSWDGNAYHIPPINLWALKGYVYWIAQPFQHAQFMNGYPKGTELLGFVVVKALGSSNWLNTTNLLFMPLGVLGIVLMARALGVSPPIAFLSGALYVMTPVSISQSATTYVDSAYASCVIAAIAVAGYAAERVRARSAPWAILPALGGAMGLAISTKTPGLLLALLVAASISVAWTVEALKVPRSRKRAFAGAAILFVVTVLAVAGVVGGYWYLRNYRHTGSPLYPVGVRLGHHVIFPGPPLTEVGLAEQVAVSMRGHSNAGKVLLAWTQAPKNWPWTVFEYDSRLGGLGYLWIFGCLPAILLVLLSAARRLQSANQRRCLLVTLGIVVLMFLAAPTNWWARFTLWIYALGLPCLGVMLDRVVRERHGPALRRFWAAAVIVIALTEGIMCLRFQIGKYVFAGAQLRPGIHHLPELITSRRPYYYLKFPKMKGTVFDAILASDDAVAIGPMEPDPARDTGKYLLVGWLSAPIGRRNIVALPLNPNSSEVERVRRESVRWIIWDDTVPLPENLRGMADWQTRAAGFRVLRRPMSTESVGHRKTSAPYSMIFDRGLSPASAGGSAALRSKERTAKT
jgi:hypothetical protein